MTDQETSLNDNTTVGLQTMAAARSVEEQGPIQDDTVREPRPDGKHDR